MNAGSSSQAVTVIGGGLAGCEVALTLARLGHAVRLVEMKPLRRTPAQVTDRLCELVCSNSLRSDNPQNAIGLLHEELRRCRSAILQAADEARVPAGDALAVDRHAFSGLIEAAIAGQPLITREAREVESLPESGVTVVATGPLTSPALTVALGELVGEKLYFYDAIAPIVSHDSIDHAVAFAQSRYDKGDGADYLNLPFTKDEYERFVAELVAGTKVSPHPFEEPRYFEGCLPIEVMAERGVQVLAFGPMKPVGLTDPRTGRRPHAVVQLRREDRAGTSWNIVGFQTRLTWPEQKRVFRGFVPGLANAEFMRMGQIHRNTFVDAPRVLSGDFSVKARADVFLAGQISGVEGYVESAACGHLVARSVDARLRGEPFVPPPQGTALGALHGHVTGAVHPDDYEYQPTNVTWGLFPPLPGKIRKHERKALMVERARGLLASWLGESSGAETPTLSAAEPEARLA